MNRYILINLLVFAGPFALSFDSRVAFFRFWPALLPALAVVSTLYIAWDILAAKRGDWSFSEKYAGGFRLFGLPAGEILFFITVPYSCIFIYEVVRAYFPETQTAVSVFAWLVPLGLLTAGIIFYRHKSYTRLALLSSALFLLAAGFFAPSLLGSTTFWYFMGLSFLAFTLVNTVLTGTPIVLYNPSAIRGIRIGPIPLEDFFYNFGMLGFYLLVYLAAKGILGL